MPFTSVLQTAVQVSLKGPWFKRKLNGMLAALPSTTRSRCPRRLKPTGLSGPSAHCTQMMSIVQFHLLQS